MLNLKDFEGKRAPNLGKRDHSLVNGEKKKPHTLDIFVFFLSHHMKRITSNKTKDTQGQREVLD